MPKNQRIIYKKCPIILEFKISVSSFFTKSKMNDTAAIIKTTILKSGFDQLDHTASDTKFLKSGSVTVLPELLEQFNKSIQNIEHWF